MEKLKATGTGWQPRINKAFKKWTQFSLLWPQVLTLTLYALNLHDEQEKVKDAELQQQRMLEQEEFERQLWSDAKASAIKLHPFSKNIRIDLVDRYTNEKTRHFIVIPQIELSIYKTDSNELISAIDKNKTVLQSLIVKDLKKLSYDELYGVNKDELIIGVIRTRLFNEIPESSGNLGWSNFPRRGLSTITLPRSFIIK